MSWPLLHFLEYITVVWKSAGPFRPDLIELSGLDFQRSRPTTSRRRGPTTSSRRRWGRPIKGRIAAKSRPHGHVGGRPSAGPERVRGLEERGHHCQQKGRIGHEREGPGYAQIGPNAERDWQLERGASFACDPEGTGPQNGPCGRPQNNRMAAEKGPRRGGKGVYIDLPTMDNIQLESFEIFSYTYKRSQGFFLHFAT